MAAVLILATGHKKGGYTGDGDPNEPAGPVHKGEYVFEANLVKGNVSKFDAIRSMLRSGVSLDKIYNNLSNKINPLPPLISDAILRTDLSSHSVRSGNINTQNNSEIISVLTDVKSVLSDLKSKGIKTNIDFEPIKVEEKFSGQHIYRSYEIQKKIEDKKKA